MISNRIRKAIQISVFAAGAALAGGAAQAAAYTGTWDPAFGAPFSNLGWGGSVDFDISKVDSNISSSCFGGTPDSDGWITLSSAPNCSASLSSASVDFYPLGSPSSTTILTFDGPSYLSKIQINSSKALIGLDGYFAQPEQPKLSIAGGDYTYFWLTFAGTPKMFWATCGLSSEGEGGGQPQQTALGQYTGGGAPYPPGHNANGWISSNYSGDCKVDASGWSGIQENGGSSTTVAYRGGTLELKSSVVPEPASLALVLGALGAGWVARRRRSS